VQAKEQLGDGLPTNFLPTFRTCKAFPYAHPLTAVAADSSPLSAKN